MNYGSEYSLVQSRICKCIRTHRCRHREEMDDCYREGARIFCRSRMRIRAYFSLPCSKLQRAKYNYLYPESTFERRMLDCVLISELVFARGLTTRREVGWKRLTPSQHDTFVMPLLSIKRNLWETLSPMALELSDVELYASSTLRGLYIHICNEFHV